MSGRFEPQEIEHPKVDRAILVGVDRPGGWDLEDELVELRRLAETAGAQVVGVITQRLDRPDPRTFIGSGKADEVASLARETDATVVIFDGDLTPSQQANLERSIPKIKVVDRTALILDIFALHATSREGKLQVELAQMEYLLPRLRGMWRHLEERLGGVGGGIATRGPGETQLETDRRLARRRIRDLKRELEGVASNRDLRRKARARSSVFRVALVGYTNAGKSTLLNALTQADVLAEDQLFATLDSTTRKLDLAEGRVVTLTDTVGFIDRLPHGLVEAFKSTLDEVREADLLLHVIDASHAQMPEQILAVEEVLQEIEVSKTPHIRVYNKVDDADPARVARLRKRHPNAVFTSARDGDGLDDVLESIAREAARGSVAMTILVPYTRGDVVGAAHERTHVVSEEHLQEGTRLMLQAPASLVDLFEPYRV
jgi:GTP-binding protein HflX